MPKKSRLELIELRAKKLYDTTDNELGIALTLILNNRPGSIDFLIQFLKNSLGRG